MGLCIQTGDIVCISGPYPCGKCYDIKTFRHGMKGKLGIGERFEEDYGYRVDINNVDIPCSGYCSGKCLMIKNNVCSCNDNVNSRFKCFNILKNKFNYELSKNGDVLGMWL